MTGDRQGVVSHRNEENDFDTISLGIQKHYTYREGWTSPSLGQGCTSNNLSHCQLNSIGEARRQGALLFLMSNYERRFHDESHFPSHFLWIRAGLGAR